MEINIVSGKFQFDGDESSDIEFNVSKLIVQMELSEMSKLGRIPENFNCSFVFSWTDPHPDGNYTIVTMVSKKCSDKNLSKELESAVNKRLFKIAKSEELDFDNQETYKILFDQIKRLPQIIEFKKETPKKLMWEKISEQGLDCNPDDDWFAEQQEDVFMVQCLLMAVSNNRIPHHAAQHVLSLINKV